MKKHFNTTGTTQRITIRTVHLQRKTKNKKLIVQKTQQPEYKLPPYTGKHKTHAPSQPKKQKQEKPVKTIHPPPPPSRIFPILINRKHRKAKTKKQEPPSPSLLSSATHSLL